MFIPDHTFINFWEIVHPPCLFIQDQTVIWVIRVPNTIWRVLFLIFANKPIAYDCQRNLIILETCCLESVLAIMQDRFRVSTPNLIKGSCKLGKKCLRHEYALMAIRNRLFWPWSSQQTVSLFIFSKLVTREEFGIHIL